MINAKKLMGLLLVFLCLSSVAVACTENDCTHQPPIEEPECTDCVKEIVITQSTETTADASGSDAEDAGVNAAANGDIEVNAANNEANGEETGDGSVVAALQDSNGNNIESESHEADAESEEGPAVAITDSSKTEVEIEETEVKIEDSEVKAPVVVGDCNDVDVVEDSFNQKTEITEIEIEDSFNQKTETTADADDGGQAGAITGNDNTLVQVGEVKVEGADVNSHNTVTIFREETKIDQSTTTTTIDNSQTTISTTMIDESVKQAIEGGVKVGDVINNGGVQVTVVGANINGDLIINVKVEGDVNIGNDGGDKGNHKETIRYVVKNNYIGGGAAVIYPATVHMKKTVVKSELVITEIKDDNGCVKSFEIKANRGPVSLDGVDIEVTDGARKAGIFMEELVLAEDERIVVEVETTIMAGTVKVKNSRGVVYAKDNFDLNQVPAGSSLQRFPEEKGVPFHIAPATLDNPNLPPLVNGVAVLGAVA